MPSPRFMWSAAFALALPACSTRVIQPDGPLASVLPVSSPQASASSPSAPKATLHPPFEKLADRLSGDLEALDDDALYAASMFGAHRIDKTSGTTLEITRQQLPNAEQHLTVDATHVYWVEMVGAFESQLLSMEKTGGTPKPLSKLSFVPEGIAVDGTRVYLTQRYDGAKVSSIHGVSKKGGAVTTLVPNRSAGRIFVDAHSVYWANYELAALVYGGNIERWSTGGSVKPLTAVGMPAPFHLVASSALFLYQGCAGYKIPNPECTVYSVPTSGGTPAAIHTGAKGCYGAFRDVAYVIDRGEVMVFEPGKPKRVLATAAPTCERLLVDDKAVYWTSNLGVIRLPR